MEQLRRKLMAKNSEYRFAPATPSVAVSPAQTAQPGTRSPRVATSKKTISCKDWSFQKLLAESARFKPVARISALETNAMLTAIWNHEKSGEPLIIENWHNHTEWPVSMFNIEWLLSRKGDDSTYHSFQVA